jgi:alpha-L-rhamnosidase
VLGEATSAEVCRRAVKRLHKFTPAPTPSKQAHALRAIASLAGAEQTNRDVLAANSFRGLSTFYGYYVLQGRAMAGDHAGAIDLIRRYWGGMLDLGATSFWEHFELDWAINTSPSTNCPLPAAPTSMPTSATTATRATATASATAGRRGRPASSVSDVPA